MEDIESYIKSVINMNMYLRHRRWTAEDKQLVIDVFTRYADGMSGTISRLLTALAHTRKIGFDGCISKWSIFVAALY
jgi:hypothetical protein